MADVYVDDRIISSGEADPIPSLRRAAERSDELDRVLRLKKHTNKKYAASTNSAIRKRMDAALGERIGKASWELEVLGVVYPYGGRRAKWMKGKKKPGGQPAGSPAVYSSFSGILASYVENKGLPVSTFWFYHFHPLHQPKRRLPTHFTG